MPPPLLSTLRLFLILFVSSICERSLVLWFLILLHQVQETLQVLEHKRSNVLSDLIQLYFWFSGYPQSGYTCTPTSAYIFPPTPTGQGNSPPHLQQLRQRGQRRQQWRRGNICKTFAKYLEKIILAKLVTSVSLRFEP